MNKKRAIVMRTGLLGKETRAIKVIEALAHSGYSVTFLGWDRGLNNPIIKQRKVGAAYREILLKFKAPSHTNTILFYPIWWCFALFQLMITKWDIVHAINFDSVPPTVIAAKLKGKLVVYDMLDTYEDSIVLPKAIRNICIKIDKLFMRLANSVILADDMQIEEVDGIPNSKVITVYDSPPDISQGITLNHRRDDVFTLFFGGILDPVKALNLDKIFTSMESIEGVKIVIAGYGDLVGEIEEWSRKMPDKIQFIGAIDHAEVLERSADADLLFMLRSPILIVNKYICGSKILEAMMCGRPILVNKGTSTASKVYKENCGLVVDANNIEEVKEAIIQLRDNSELCEKLGANARKAYEERYSWDIMEKRLADLYQELTGGVD